MFKLFASFLLVALLLPATTQAQNVGIGTATPAAAAALEVQATNKGFLPPRVAAASAIANPVQGLLVFQMDAPAGYYYYTGAAWVQLSPVGADWTTTGNTGTTAANNFLGTNDAQPLVVKTSGAGAANERLRVQADGRVVVNRASAQTGDQFSVYGAGASGALNSGGGYAINGYSVGANGGVYGENTGTGQGVLGSNTSAGAGVYGTSNNANGSGVFGYNQVAGVAVNGLSTGGIAVNGSTNGAGTAAVRGFNQDVTGTGVQALGNNITAGVLPSAGAGLAATGTGFGAYSVATSTSSSVGVYGSGNNLTSPFVPSSGAGVVGLGASFGVVGYVTSAAPSNDRWAGYFDYRTSTNGYAFVGGRLGNTDYAILSAGTKSTMVPDGQGQNRVMYCPEAPEVLFQDFGTGQLREGRAHIALDPLLARNVHVSDQHPLRVFIQLEGDCRGVYVANKSAAGFDVVELNGGRANVDFTWQLVANRADAVDAQGQVTSRFADLRFPVAPARPAVQQVKTLQAAVPAASPAAANKAKRP